MFAVTKQEMVLEAQTRALNAPRYKFLQRVRCGNESFHYKNYLFPTNMRREKRI